ncbi:Cthe_2314 family HEPN domain-containing protein [Pseudotamlana agarivorans]|uniref:Cthe_2314 family HEPN domain-containing protein n=1 Tax=Pseudotamlana agarivorans TaxID=481183 RepID=UPI0008342C16|nr:Cthe_2314 family HEPN domain-containing protein [Tamlana agarivorans]
MSSKTIKNKFYKYPSLEEGLNQTKFIPNYECFLFKRINSITSVLNGDLETDEVNRRNNLDNWNRVLTNKLFKLHETELFLRVHFERGIQDNIIKSNEKELVDGIQFQYFVEIYYYFYFSCLDILAHILNCFYNLKFKEHKIGFKEELLNKIHNDDIKDLLNEFNSSIKNTREYRNHFTHKFPKNENDSRTNLSHSDGRNMIHISMGNRVKNEEFLKNIEGSSKSLKILLDKLKLEFDDHIKELKIV